VITVTGMAIGLGPTPRSSGVSSSVLTTPTTEDGKAASSAAPRLAATEAIGR
jgi:hypothetical protein